MCCAGRVFILVLIFIHLTLFVFVFVFYSFFISVFGFMSFFSVFLFLLVFLVSPFKKNKLTRVVFRFPVFHLQQLFLFLFRSFLFVFVLIFHVRFQFLIVWQARQKQKNCSSLEAPPGYQYLAPRRHWSAGGSAKTGLAVGPRGGRRRRTGRGRERGMGCR